MTADLGRKRDYTDYLATPDDGQRYEIVRGELHVTPAPTPWHQRVSKRLMLQLVAYFEERSLGEVFDAPIDLILGSTDIVQPDLLVVADPAQISGRGIERAPLLVVEILSPSTRQRDRGVKARRYAELGVAHYWIVDPERRDVECRRLSADGYETVAAASADTVLEHPDWPDLALDLSALWR